MNILDSLTRIDEDNEYCFLVPDQPEYRALKLDAKRHTVHYYRRRVGHLGRWFFDAYTLKRICSRFRPDVVWGMGNLGLISPPCPQAVSIQNPYLFYDVKNTGRLSLTDRLWLFFLKRHFKRQLPATVLVFCQTAAMQERLRTIFGYKGRSMVTSKVVSAFSASNSAEGKLPSPIAHAADKYKLFYLARYYPHKGLEVMVEMMDRYREELSDTVAVITIAAEQHKNAARLLDAIRKRGLEDYIINVGPLKQDQLAEYYGSCDCLVMPTRLESFSGTYLESMHFGLPILTSNLDFAREVCGDAALYFDPWDAESIKDAIIGLKNDPELRRTLVERGRIHLSQKFGRTWEDIARETKKGLESLITPKGN
jgi:glycosyltransferase involved in cell wall biosynthesis